jgi:hypothetical protein
MHSEDLAAGLVYRGMSEIMSALRRSSCRVKGTSTGLFYKDMSEKMSALRRSSCRVPIYIFPEIKLRGLDISKT